MKHQEYFERYFPGLPIRSIESVTDQGLCNDLLIVNREIVIRTAKNEETKALLRQEHEVLVLIREKTDIPLPDMQVQEDGAVWYPYMEGIPLFRHKLLRLDISRRQSSNTARTGSPTSPA